jgi:ribonuclease HI
MKKRRTKTLLGISGIQRKNRTHKLRIGKNTTRIYTDGACEPNPGIGGCAAIVIYPDGYTLERTEHHDDTTNNRMEIRAAILGLLELSGSHRVIVYSDSQYLVNTMMRGWKKKKNTDLWQELDDACGIHNVKFEWVKGHNGDKYNEMCDSLAEEARKRSRRQSV